jgi:uncharacterized protein YkwD
VIGLGVSSQAQTGQVAGRATADDPRDRELVSEVLAAHNKVRADEKLPALALDPKLVAAARAHAEDMAAQQKMTHDGKDGSTPSQRIEREKYHPQSSGENVATGQTTADEVMKTWMESPRHRENILGRFTQAGIAVARDRDGKPYWCVDFATPWPVLDPSRAAADVVAALNRERAAAGKKPLKAVRALNRVAAGQAKALARADSLEGGRGRGDDLLKAVEDEQYRYRKLAEVSASGQPAPADVVSSLLESPQHRESLLGDFTEAGVGYATSEKGTPYWSLILARPPLRE